MSRRHPRAAFHELIPGRKPEPGFRWRGREVLRIEGFSDAVFAFAVTLLIVALEVPHSFEELKRAIYGFPAFVVCFALLMTFWTAHYKFFRRYGLEDRFTRLISLGILLLVLFSVYPLKYLFATVLQFGPGADGAFKSWEELQFVYLAYGLGFAGIWALYALLYAHVLRQRAALQLNSAEYWVTRAQFVGFLIDVAVCLVSIVVSRLFASPAAPGLVYASLMILLPLNTRWHRKQAAFECGM